MKRENEQERDNKFKLTSEDRVGNRTYEQSLAYDKSELSSTPSEKNPLGLFLLKTKFNHRKTNPEAESAILPLVTHELYNYQYYGR